jgi:hypothetical protein
MLVKFSKGPNLKNQSLTEQKCTLKAGAFFSNLLRLSSALNIRTAKIRVCFRYLHALPA